MNKHRQKIDRVKWQVCKTEDALICNLTAEPVLLLLPIYDCKTAYFDYLLMDRPQADCISGNTPYNVSDSVSDGSNSGDSTIIGSGSGGATIVSVSSSKFFPTLNAYNPPSPTS